jgi:hypothetical protein
VSRFNVVLLVVVALELGTAKRVSVIKAIKIKPESLPLFTMDTSP